MTQRLKASELPAWRTMQEIRQAGRCLLCGGALGANPVADHCHSTGVLRAVLHRGCNALLGKIENNYRRYGVTPTQLKGISPRIAAYLKADYLGRPLYPTHKTEDEKRLARNKKARARRAAEKENA